MVCHSESTRQICFRSPGTEVIKKGRNVFPFSFQIPDRCVFLIFVHFHVYTLGALQIIFCCRPVQKTSIYLYIHHWQNHSQVKSRVKAVDEVDQEGQSSLYICIQAGHGYSRADGKTNKINTIVI